MLVVPHVNRPTGQPELALCWVGVSETKSSAQSPSPKIWRNPNQWPVSCERVLPLLYGACMTGKFPLSAEPKEEYCTTTPSVEAGPPVSFNPDNPDWSGNWAYPNRLALVPPNFTVHTL